MAKHYQKTEKGYKNGFLKGPENLSEKEKEKQQQFGHKQYQNLPEHE